MIGEVFSAVDGKSEYRRVAGEDNGCPVALVHVAIDDHDALRPPFGLHKARRHGDIVKNAISLAMVRVGVMGATSQAGCNAIFQSCAANSDRSAHRAARALHQPRRPGKADASHFTLVDRALQDFLHILGCVDQQELLVGGGFGVLEISSGEDAHLQQALAQARIFWHREAVFGWQGKGVVVVEKGFHDVYYKSIASKNIKQGYSGFTGCFLEIEYNSDMVRLQIPNAYRSYTAASETLLEGETVGEAFADLLHQYPALRPHVLSPNGEIRPFISLFVNGENIKALQGMETALKAGDSLRMVASIAGG